jgi:putative peptidoglycan lipid II flippase
LAAEPSATVAAAATHSRHVARFAASAGAATMASRILGLVRDQVLASFFGASATIAMDAYYVAFRIPNLLRDLFAEGAMSAAFVPTFTSYLTTRGKNEALRVGNNVVNAIVVILGVLVILGVIFTDPLVRLLTDDAYASNPEKMALTISLARIMLPSLLFIALAAALMGMLNSLHHYFIPALSPAMFNVMTILSAFALVPVLAQLGVAPITAIAIGTTVGGVAQLALQWPALRREGYRYRPAVDWHDEGLRRVLLLMGPGTIGMAATQVNLLVNTQLATGQGQGAVSWLSYAFRLMYLPIGLFGVSIATATLPTVSRQVAEKNLTAVRDTMTRSISLMLMLNVPATIGLIVLAVPIVRVIFEHGRFTAYDTTATATALQFYTLGLVGYSIVRIASPVFYALGRNRVPVVVGVMAVLVNAGLNYTLVRVMGYGYASLAFGTSIAALFNAIVLFTLLRGSLGGLNGRQLAGTSARIVVASIAMGVAAIAADRYLPTLIAQPGLMWEILRLGATIAIALGVLAAAAWALRIREFNESVDMVLRRLRRRAQ